MADINENASINISVNDKQARDKLDDLVKKTEEARKKFEEAYAAKDTKGIEKTSKSLGDLTRQLEHARTNAENIRATMVNLDQATPRELQKTIRAITKELNSGRVKRGSAEWQAYTEQLRRVKEELARVNSEMNVVGASQEGFLSRFAGTFTKWWGTYTIMTDAIDGVNMKFAQLKKNFRDKEDSKANLKALTGLDDESISWLTQQAEVLSTTMHESGLRVKQSSKEILDAYMLVGSNKPELLTDKEALNSVTIEAMRLATASSMKLQPAVDAMTTALNQYGAGAEEAARYVNVLAAGSKFGAANVEQQSASILKAGTAAASANVKFEELVGSIEMLGEKGIKGEIAGTGLKKFFLVLQTGTAQTNPKVVGLSTALDNLKSKVDDAERRSVGGGASFLKKMFGEEAYSIAAILTDNTAKVKEYTEAVTGTQTAMEQAAINSDTTGARIAQLGNKVKEAGIELIEKLNPSLGILANWSSRLIDILPGLIDFLIKHRGAIISLAIAIVSYNLYLNKSIILSKLQYLWTEKACKGFMRLVALASSNPWGLVAMGVALLVGWLIDLNREQNLSLKMQEDLNKIRKKAGESVAEERVKIDLLVAAAKNETLSLEERRKAIDKLNKIIPGYNASLDETSGKYTANAEALDNYLKKLSRKYELEGAKDLLKQLGKEKAEANKALIEAKRNLETAEFTATKGLGRAYTTSYGAVGNTIIDATAHAKEVLDSAEKTVAEIEEREKSIFKAYGVDLQKSAVADTPATPTSPKKQTSFESEEERRERFKEEREQARIENEQLKKDLEEQKKIRDLAEVNNLTRYTTGLINFREYTDRKEQIEREYLANQKKVHEKHGKEDTATYAAVLRQEAEQLKKSNDEKAALSAQALERLHAIHEDGIMSDFYNPSGPLFLNQKALDQRMLEEDIRYLEQKKQLYAEGSAERLDIEKQIDDRLAEDKLEKQRQTADAMAEFEKRYRKSSGSEREKLEISILDSIHAQGLISEEEHQTALADIRKKFRDEDIDKARTVNSEYADMVVNLVDSFSELFTNLSSQSSDFWDNLSNAATATYATIGAAMSQYSAYADASRDLEVAKIEKRYDAEIKAAGKNTKKAEQLEKKKEADIAKVKKKYNDRAMKMEIAQAVAQTATAAIAAYASASKVNWLLGPVAAAMATAAGMIQIATIKKQHEAQAMGYYDGGFTPSDPDNRREVGTVHANEFVANHKAVSNPALTPVLRLIDIAQRSNTVGALTADDVANAIGRSRGGGEPERGCGLRQRSGIGSSGQRAGDDRRRDGIGQTVARPTFRKHRGRNQGVHGHGRRGRIP